MVSKKIDQQLAGCTQIGLILAVTLASVSLARAEQQSGHAHHGHHDHAAEETATPAVGEWTLAEVRKVDLAQGRITLRHERIESLDMAPMTMVFRVGDGVSTETLSEGTKVRFQVVRDTGRLVITALERVTDE